MSLIDKMIKNVDLITIVLSALGIITFAFAVLFFTDFFKNRNNLGNHNTGWKVTIIGFITNFFDALGIGSFAPTTALLKSFNQINDRVLPGTLNVACTIPVAVEAFIFMKVIDIEPTTLVCMLLAASIGSYVGAGIVSKLPEKTIQITMGIALFISAILMILSQFKLLPMGGDAIYLSGTKLLIGIVGNFIFGALMTAGIGLYAPCMVLVSMLGMSPDTAFPIMMGSCAFLMPVASMKFVKEGAYDRRASMGITIGGVIGVIIAIRFFKGLPIEILNWLVIIVAIYTAVGMFKSTNRKRI